MACLAFSILDLGASGIWIYTRSVLPYDGLIGVALRRIRILIE